LWIKGRGFTLAGLLGSTSLARTFAGGPLAIFRLAPQDYHRFHSPVTGRLAMMKPISGTYLTVNPMAIRENVDVLTENKRHLVVIDSVEFGRVAFIAVGATLVGSIVLTRRIGEHVQKGVRDRESERPWRI
jgi:phosphatidylserine decarboxylase